MFGNFVSTINRPVKRDYSNAQPWSPDISWEPQLVIKADSYKPDSLFPVKPTLCRDPNYIGNSDERVLSPNGQWIYSEVVLPKGTPLTTWYGRRLGKVFFDGDVVIPRIMEKRAGRFSDDPWMSLTPAEIISMRAGVRKATGTCVIAGLGMGHLLSCVDKKKSVTNIILVEQSQQLIDWVLPRLNITKPLKVICGDARKIVPEMTDVNSILVDIDASYGNNRFPSCKACMPWVWGSVKMY